MTGTPPPNPRVNDVWIDDAGELFYWNGSDWMPYEDPPEWPGDGDPGPNWLYRDDS
jgi:hypothetical protein